MSAPRTKHEQLSKHLSEIRSRLLVGRWDAVAADVSQRLATLRKELESTESGELCRHIPVAVIAALQTYVRGVVVDLVDRGEPYRSRAAGLLNDKVAVADAISWFHESSFTFGEVVARAANYNSIGGVLSAIGMLLDVDVKQRLATAVDPYDRKEPDPDSRPVVGDVDGLLRDVETVFRARHILAHEAAVHFALEHVAAVRALDSVRLLISGLDAVLWETAYIDRPLTQIEINDFSYEEFLRAKEELNGVLTRARKIAQAEGCEEWFIANQTKWDAHSREWIEGAYLNRSGTLWPGVASAAHAKAVKERIAQLAEWIAWSAPENPA